MRSAQERADAMHFVFTIPRVIVCIVCIACSNCRSPICYLTDCHSNCVVSAPSPPNWSAGDVSNSTAPGFASCREG